MTNEPEERMIKRIEQVNRLTVEDLVDWCLHKGLHPSTVRITGTHLTWESLETDQERKLRQDWQESRDLRTAEYERATYERLKAKFEAQL